MQFTVTINQEKAREWGLNAQQAMLFAFVYEVPSWANAVTTDDGVFFALSKLKIIEELPLLTDKPDTAYRMLRALRDKGLVELSSTNAISLIRLTDKARTWNKKSNGSEKYPSGVGKKSEEGRKKIRGGSEKSPTNQDTSNHDTKNQETQGASGDAPGKPPSRPGKTSAYPEDFEEAWYEYPSREGSNPKNHAYSAWKARKAEGVLADQMIAGVRRYAEFCRAKGSVGTSYVMQAKRFFGTAREFDNGWQVVTTPPERFGRSMTQADRLHAANQEAIRQAVENRRNGTDHGAGDTFDNDGGHW